MVSFLPPCRVRPEAVGQQPGRVHLPQEPGHRPVGCAERSAPLRVRLEAYSIRGQSFARCADAHQGPTHRRRAPAGVRSSPVQGG